jgi:hypothetical protein
MRNPNLVTKSSPKEFSFTIMMFIFISIPPDIHASEATPDQLEFRRQAVRRFIFDRSQDIQLAGLWPAKVVGLDVMHPPVRAGGRL